MTTATGSRLALHGGPQAVERIEGQAHPKVGIEEFLSVAERFGFSEEALGRLRAAIGEEDLGGGASLARYGGPPASKGAALEEVVRELFGVKYVVPVSSGTAALHSAFVAAGVGPGTEVVCPAIGFYATAAAVVHAKGVPVFCDVDESLAMDPAKIEPLISERTVALAPTHVMGSVCDMDPILEVARRHGLRVIEDCAQSCGGRYRGRYVGALGDLGCFSISCYKIIGGGEGGLVVTDDERLRDRACQLAECGGLWRPDRFAPPRYEGELFCGTNYRMSELEAAVNVVQMRNMPEVVGRHHRVKTSILERLKTYREITPQTLNDLQGEIGYSLRFFPQTIELGRQIVEALRAEGIGAGMRGQGGRPDWHIYSDMFPITLKGGATGEECAYWCPRYRERGGNIEYARGDCPVADDLFDRVVSIGLSQWYTARDCENIAAGINKVLGAFCTEDPGARPWM